MRDSSHLDAVPSSGVDSKMKCLGSIGVARKETGEETSIVTPPVVYGTPRNDDFMIS